MRWRNDRRIGDMRVESVRRLPRRDRSWRHTVIAKAIGGLESPPQPAILRAQLYAIAASNPRRGMLRLLDASDGSVGRPVAADLRTFCDALVAVDDLWAGTGLTAHVARIRRRGLAGLPFRLTIGPDWVGLAHNHAIGDGNTSFRLMLDLAAGSTSAQVSGEARGTPFPLGRALLRTYAGNPARALAVLREPRAPLPVLSGGGETTPLRDNIEVMAASSDEHYLPRLRRERAAMGSKSSIFANLIAKTFAYLRDCGVATYPGFTTMVDARRYLRPNAEVIGNFSAGSFLECGPVPTAEDVMLALHTLVRNGRPLLSMLMSVLTADVRIAGWTVDPAARTLLSFSHQGRVVIPAVPEDRQSALSIVTMGLPLGPHGISINTSEVGGKLNVSASYRPDAISADIVSGLVATLTTVGAGSDSSGRIAW